MHICFVNGELTILSHSETVLSLLCNTELTLSSPPPCFMEQGNKHQAAAASVTEGLGERSTTLVHTVGPPVGDLPITPACVQKALTSRNLSRPTPYKEHKASHLTSDPSRKHGSTVTRLFPRAAAGSLNLSEPF